MNGLAQRSAMSDHEAQSWRSLRGIVHFVGVCGAGKSTMQERLAQRIEQSGAVAIRTIDYDPRVSDDRRQEDRAFNRRLDAINNSAGREDGAELIVSHTLALLERWKSSNANVVLVDRWHESYDNLPVSDIKRLEEEISASGFQVRHVHLVVDGGPLGDEREALRERLLHTKRFRPRDWWESGPGSIDKFVEEEWRCQNEYAKFIERSPFASTRVRTCDMDWGRIEEAIVQSLIGIPEATGAPRRE